MKIGLSSLQLNNFKPNQNRQVSGMPKMQTLQRDTVCFGEFEEEFADVFRKFITDPYADNSRDLAVLRQHVTKNHPIIKTLIKEFEELKEKGSMKNFQRQYVEEFVLPEIT